MEEITPNVLIQCSQCDSIVQLKTVFCSNCGFPENGTEKEAAVFHARKAMNKNKNMDAGKKINSARNTLYVMAAINFVFGLVFFFTNQDTASLVASMILSIIYLLLAFWSSKKPLMALLLGLLLYLTTIIISAIFDPVTIVKGILWKVLIIAYLGKGIYSASSLNKEQ